MARERYRESLHLLDIAGAAALSGHVLTDLAMLAVHQNQPFAAREHAEAAVRATCAGGSRAGQARELAVLARAHALNDDLTDAQRALGLAQETLGHVDADAEQVYALHRHLDPDQVAALVAAASTTQDGMHRRRLLVTLTLAATHLAHLAPARRDPERAAGTRSVPRPGDRRSARLAAWRSHRRPPNYWRPCTSPVAGPDWTHAVPA